MGFDLFSSSSETDQRTQNIDNSQTGSGSATLIRNQKSGNVKGSGNQQIKAGKGATVTITTNQGPDAATVAAAVASRLAAQTAPSVTGLPGGSPVNDAVNQRVTDQVADGALAANRLQTWGIVALVVVLLLVGGAFLRKKKQ